MAKWIHILDLVGACTGTAVGLLELPPAPDGTPGFVRTDNGQGVYDALAYVIGKSNMRKASEEHTPYTTARLSLLAQIECLKEIPAPPLSEMMYPKSYRCIAQELNAWQQRILTQYEPWHEIRSLSELEKKKTFFDKLQDFGVNAFHTCTNGVFKHSSAQELKL